MKVALRLALGLGLLASAADAAEIKMIASNAVKETYIELVPQFEKATGHKVTLSWGGTADVIRRVNAGEVADIALATSEAIDALLKGGKLVAGSRVDHVKSLTAVAVRQGLPKPDIPSGAALSRALVASKSVVVSGGPSGTYMLELFQKMGIADSLKAKLTQTPPGAGVGDAMVKGAGDIGFTQVSEFLHVKGVELVGPLPKDVELVTTFSSGLLPNAPQPEAAKALVRFLTAPATAAVVKKNGLEPS